jgi:hypothetical protein
MEVVQPLRAAMWLTREEGIPNGIRNFSWGLVEEGYNFVQVPPLGRQEICENWLI